MKNAFKLLILIFVSFYSAKADYIHSISVKINSVDFSIRTDDNINNYIAVVTLSANHPELPTTITNNPDEMIIEKDLYYFKGTANNSFKIENLNSSAQYYIHLFANKNGKYQHIEKTHFCTLSGIEPNNPQGIAYKYLGDNGYNFMFNAIKGNGYIIVASPNKITNSPKAGKKYTAAPFGAKIKNYEGSETVIYNSEGTNNQKSLELTINSPEKFYLAVFSYVGKDDCVIYDTEIGKNMRQIIPGLNPPVAIDSRSFPDGFLARWKSVAGADSYIIDVATDSKFKNILDGYNAIDFGNTTEVPIIIDDNDISEVYYRVRAAGNGKLSSNSNVVTVRLK